MADICLRSNCSCAAAPATHDGRLGSYFPTGCVVFSDPQLIRLILIPIQLQSAAYNNYSITRLFHLELKNNPIYLGIRVDPDKLSDFLMFLLRMTVHYM